MLLLDPLGHLDLPFLEPPELRVSLVPLDVPDVMELKEQLSATSDLQVTLEPLVLWEQLVQREVKVELVTREALE